MFDDHRNDYVNELLFKPTRWNVTFVRHNFDCVIVLDKSSSKTTPS